MDKHKIESSLLNVGYLIRKTELYLKLGILKQFKDNSFNLTFEQFDLLHILYQEDNISQSELGKVALKDKANVARILGILEEKGFIERKLSTHCNRMVKKIFITGEGRAEVDKMMPIIQESYEETLKGLSERRIKDLIITLEIYRNNLVKVFNLDIYPDSQSSQE
jgi:MarR family transcriptional regulator, organic hydroperoxide resistance regulator